MKQKNTIRTYRNGKSVFQMGFTVRLKPEIAGKKHMVTEQRSEFKDEKIIFWGSESDAEKFYTDTVSTTIVNGVVQKTAA